MTDDLIQQARHSARNLGEPIQILDVGGTESFFAPDRLRRNWDDDGPVIRAVVHPNGVVS